MKSPLYILALTMAFMAGAITHAVWIRNPRDEVQLNSESNRSTARQPTNQIQSANHPGDKESGERSGIEGPRLLKLKPEVVEAILSGGDIKRKLLRMGLAENQVEAVSMIQKEATAALKGIEKEHAKVVSDDRGEYVAISAFPVERRKWLEHIEADLRDLLGDDRAAVIARMIAFADNDEDVGIYRRELFVTEARRAGNKVLIEERTFNEEGKHIDSDYEEAGAQSESRWGHLLKIGGK